MWLLPAKAVWWPAESMLVVSDLHLAKAEHFRSQGLAVPPTVDFQTLSVLTSAMKACRPKTLVLLGDLFHSSPNRAWEDFEAWLQDEKAAGLETGILVRGNHDRAHDVVYEAMGLDVVDLWEKQGVVLTHEPDDDIPKGTRFHLCGHVPSRRRDARCRTAVRAGAVLCPVVDGVRSGVQVDAAGVWRLHRHARRGAQTRGRSVLGHRTRGHRPCEVDAFTKRLQSTRSKVRVPVTGKTVLP